MKSCPLCGSLIINEICPTCNRSFLTPPRLNAVLFDLNPHLKKRLEWRENIRKHSGMEHLPVDPTKFNFEDLPPKMIPTDMELFLRKKKENNSQRVEF